MTRRTALACFALLALAACEEMRTPQTLARIPAALSTGNPDPVLGIVRDAAEAFQDAGRSLSGNPGALALAAAQLEVMTEELGRDLRWAPLPPGILFELRGARTELRAAIGLRANASPDAAARALSATQVALGRGDRAAALAALSPALFEPGGERTLDYLTRPGPLPYARNATAAARDAVDQLLRDNRGGLVGAMDPDASQADMLPGRALGR